MRRHPFHLAGARRTAAAAVATTALLAAAGTSTAQDASGADSATAGYDGSRMVLDHDAAFYGVDLATDAHGTSYLGWISSVYGDPTLRQVHLCVLPRGAGSCKGGVQTASALDPPSASGLHVVVDGGGIVHLVWIHDTANSSSSVTGDALAQATVSGGILGSSADVTSAPSYGTLEDVIALSSGGIAAVAPAAVGTNAVYYYSDLSAAPTYLGTSGSVGHAALAAAGSTTVVVYGDYGSISQPLHYAYSTGGAFSSPRNVSGTWTLGTAFDLAASRSGIRLISSVANASYHPAISKWQGTGFSRPALTGGDWTSCQPSSHDLVTDASGRLADVSFDCSNMGLANFPDTTRAEVKILKFAGTTVAEPAVTTTPSGRGWVAWEFEQTAPAGNELAVQSVRLPALSRRVSRHGSAGSVTVTGPASCLPVVSSPTRVKAKAAHGWTVKGKSLTLSGHRLGSSVNGARLKPNHSYSILGTATFAKGKTRRSAKATLGFHTCGRP